MISFLEELPLLGRLIALVLELLGLSGAGTVLASAVALGLTLLVVVVLAVIPGWLGAIVVIYALVHSGPRLLRKAAHLPAFRNVVNTTAIAVPTISAYYLTPLGYELLAAGAAAVGAVFGVLGAQDDIRKLSEPATG